METLRRLAGAHLPSAAHEALSNPDADLEALGLDSLMLAGLMLDVEDHFGVTFPADRVTRDTFRSLRTLQAALTALLAPPRPESGPPAS